MPTIHAVLLTAVVLGALRAQGSQPVMVGMPEYGVVLSGTPDDPIIENHSGRVIIAYSIDTVDANGRLGGVGQILALSVLPAGLPDGKSLYAMGNFPVDPNRPRGNRAINSGARPAVRATLACVIFGDGHFVGADERGVFERLGNELKAVKEVGVLAKAGAWDQVEVLAKAPARLLLRSPSGEDPTLSLDRREAAERLVETWRPKGGVAAARAAVQLAEIYSSLAAPWK